MSVNKVILVGNAGRDAEVRYLDNGTAVASFTLATSETYTAKSGEKVTTTEWHNIVAWRGLGETAGKYVKKGRQLFIEGRIRTRAWDDKDGNKRYTTEIYADTIQFLGKKEGGESSNGAPSVEYHQDTNQVPASTVNDFDAGDSTDDLPF